MSLTRFSGYCSRAVSSGPRSALPCPRIPAVLGPILVGILLLGVTACEGGDSIPIVPQGSLPLADALIVGGPDSVRLTVEVASKAEERAFGLMDRDSLEADHGMLFLFEEDRPSEAAFYMYRTRIPLDIAFVNEEGTIVAVRTMEPCTSPVASHCQRYAAGAVHRTVLETNAGYFASKGIGAGARLTWELRR